MASSRIFVQRLPPSIAEDDFRKHFSSFSPVTDVKLFPQRRIGFVGFRSAEDATRAVKYFNKSYIRMSRIEVELADNKLPKTHTNYPTSRHGPSLQNETPDTNPLKRKRAGGENSENDVKGNQKEAYEMNVSVSAPGETEISEPKDTAPMVEADGRAELEASDADWMRSRTSRLLGLVDDDEQEDEEMTTEHTNLVQPENNVQEPTPPPDDILDASEENEEEEPLASDGANVDPVEQTIRESHRLFLRNLPYNVSEADLSALFNQFGTLHEVHLPLDPKSGSPKGFAFVQFDNPENAIEAFRKCDGIVFQGRLLHILPATVKKENKLDEYAIAKLPIKKQRQIQKRTEAANSTFSWNSMFMNADSVLSSISDRLNVPKSELLDPTSSDAAVKQAQAETHVIQETKAYFAANGVDLNAFKSRERGETTILVKNFAYGTKVQELKQLFEAHGDVTRILMPPSGTIAIVEFANAAQARSAFSALAYRKLGDSVLFLEKAPKGIFDGKVVEAKQQVGGVAPKKGTTDLMRASEDEEAVDTTTLFVRNLNFATTNERFRDIFQPLDGFISARIKTKPDPKKQGGVLSMGFGFLEFRSAPQARAALAAMNGYNLDGHQLLIKASHKGHDAAEERRRQDDAKKRGARVSKIVIKNLPFEASRKDVRNLFKSYGQLRAVRVPKKFDNSRKGFAFAEFTNPREAENAMEALSNTHLLGRRLVLDYAAGDTENPEEELEKMQRKIGKQSDNVALQRLASRSERKKIRIGDGKEGDDE